MAEAPLQILAIGTLQRDSTSVVIEHIPGELREARSLVDVSDFRIELQRRGDQADVTILATPDYRRSVSGAINNFLDHFGGNSKGNYL